MALFLGNRWHGQLATRATYLEAAAGSTVCLRGPTAGRTVGTLGRNLSPIVASKFVCRAGAGAGDSSVEPGKPVRNARKCDTCHSDLGTTGHVLATSLIAVEGIASWSEFLRGRSGYASASGRTRSEDDVAGSLATAATAQCLRIAQRILVCYASCRSAGTG